MKPSWLVTVFLLLVVTLAAIAPTSAQQTHTLEWGVEVGEEFTYVLQRKLVEAAWEQNMNDLIPFLPHLDQGQKILASVDDLEEIPTEVDPSDLPKSWWTLVRENDSVSISAGISGFAFPIGDWDVLGEAFNVTGIAGTTLIDTNEEWGTILSGPLEGSSDIEVYHEQRYEKENGTQVFLRWTIRHAGYTVVDIVFVQWHLGMPTILAGELEMTTILLAGIGAVFAIIVGVVVYKRVKARKSLMQKLGE
ncbi:MAG: hypothetical protein ACTSPR_03340 [Candidatus Thorarchaeota archaeon]